MWRRLGGTQSSPRSKKLVSFLTISEWWSDALRSAASIVLAYAGFAAISLQVNFEHFTWWSLATTALWGFVNAFYPKTGGAFFFLFFGIQISVVAGVIVMGLLNCNVFSESHSTNGDAAFILGNYVRRGRCRNTGGKVGTQGGK